MRKIVYCAVLFMYVCLSSSLLPLKTFALSDEQRKLLKSGVYYFNSEDDARICTPGQNVITNPTSGNRGNFDPVTLRYPSFPDEPKIAADLVSYITNDKPSSPLLGIPDFGNWLLQAAKARDVNPLFVFGSAKVESQFGTSDLGLNNNNFFGITAGNNGYRSFPSPQAGVEYFLDDLKENTQGGDSIYSNATNIYEYFSIHQTGSIVYPGEDFDPRDVNNDGNTKDLYDPRMGVWISWDPNKNPDGAQYTPLIYYKNIINMFNDAFGLNLPAENPQRGGLVACTGPGQGPNGKLDTTGYSFPLEPQDSSIGGVVAGQTTTRHHDGTPAFDLFSTIPDADVYAIHGGTPVNINRSYGGVEGCSSIQFLADDGFYYWYGHIKNVTVEEGVRVESGTRMAELADSGMGSACIGSAPHLHIDRGCVTSEGPQTGGRDACRDPDFIPFLSAIFERLGSS